MVADAFSIKGGLEIIQVAESVAREKNLKRDSVIDALQEAVVSVAKKKYGHELNIRAEISEKDGSIRVFRELEVIDENENKNNDEGESENDYNTKIDIKHAQVKNPDAKIGDIVSEELPPIDFGRVAGQTFKQVLMSKIRDAEREREFEDFKDRIGEIATGVVERIERNGDLLINFGKTETILPRDQVIPRETYRKGDRIRAYITDVRRERKGPQIFLSRVSPDFLTALFTQEVPEIYDGLVKIKAVARDPGSRAKVAVYSEDNSIDPVGSCIGPRGSRVTSVYNELQGEKIDIIEWSNDLATLSVNAIGSKTRDSVVEVVKIVIDEDNHKVTAVVPDDQLSLAIGRRGQNVRLASELIGWNIDMISESDDSQRSVEEFTNVSQHFADALNVEEVIGQLLASEGFTSMEEVAYVDKADLLGIEGFEEDLVEELQKRAEDYLEKNKDAVAEANKKTQKVASDQLTSIEFIDGETAGKFIKKGIKKVDDLAELSTDEFIEILGEDSAITEEQAGKAIIQAREQAGWFDEKPESDTQPEEEIKEAANN
jgi:N utilization substance protein A